MHHKTTDVSHRARPHRHQQSLFGAPCRRRRPPGAKQPLSFASVCSHFFFLSVKSRKKEKKKTFKATPIINNNQTLSGQSKRHNMKCSFQLALTTGSLRWRDRFVLRRFGWSVTGMGQTGEEGAGSSGRIIWRVSKVLQVTVQVKRQILSAV